MTSSGTFGVHFVIRNNKQLNGRSPVYARITVNGTRCELALKEYLSPADWNAGKGMTMPKNKALKQFNSYLEEVRGKLARHYMAGNDLYEVVNEKIVQVWLFSEDQAKEDEFWGN